MNYQFHDGDAFARELDQKDPLKHFRERFYTLKHQIYMDGNSLGLLSKDAEASLLRVLNEFKELGINGWMQGSPPWYTFAEELARKQALLVGAEENEIIVHASTTVNLHNLLSTFFKLNSRRNKVLIDELNFPSDKYAVDSQLHLHGLNPEEHCIVVKSEDGHTLKEADIVAAMTEDIAVVLLPSVLYRSGQLLDMEFLIKEAHKRDIIIGFDCCHSVGAIPHTFSKWGLDFAFWCNYKYMNNGPGGTASLYINKKHFHKSPGLQGWWGSNKEKQFDMSLEFQQAPHAGAWQIGTVGLFSTAPLEGSLNIFLEAGIEEVRKKSLTLTAYMIYLIDIYLSSCGFSIGTPREDHRRGGHVALQHPTEALRINEALKKRGVIPDFRPPNTIRLAPIALYNSYSEVWQVIQHIKEIMVLKEYENFSKERDTVS